MNSSVENVQYEHVKHPFLQGIRDCIPTLLGYISIGVAFGIVGSSSQLNMIEIALLTILVYAGSAQFIFCALVLSGTPPLVIIFTIFIVNLRHFLMSLSVAPYFTKYSYLRNIGFGSLLTDETFGVAITKLMQTKEMSGRWLDGLNITAYAAWIVSCLGGALLGKWITAPEKWGLDFALIAMFVALLVLQLQSAGKTKLTKNLCLIGTVAILMYVFSYFMPLHLAVILSTIFAATIGVVMDR